MHNVILYYVAKNSNVNCASVFAVYAIVPLCAFHRETVLSLLRLEMIKKNWIEEIIINELFVLVYSMMAKPKSAMPL